MKHSHPEPWLLLIHNIPPKPSYFRAKVWRRLQRLGAVAIKNSVYVLPNSDTSYESFEWVIREIHQGGGEATLCEANFVEGLEDAQVQALFSQARSLDYATIVEEARKVLKVFRRKSRPTDERRKEVEADLARLKRRLADMVTLDFFGASGRAAAEEYVNEIEGRLRSAESGSAILGKPLVHCEDLQGRTWVTRRGIHIDRMASAWLIRRFIDPRARFKFVEGKDYRPKKGELRFDMFGGEFTHEGDLCTFEVLIKRTRLKEMALQALGEIVHDIDLKDGKFNREEAPGIDHLIAGICMRHREDEARLARGAAVFEDLCEYFRRKRK